MALWGTKKKEDSEDSSAPEVVSGVMPSRAPETHAHAGARERESNPNLNAPPSASMAPQPQTIRFGIDQTIQLMRSLPKSKDSELVVAVMKTTLESVNVRVPDIIRDATKRLNDVEARVTALKTEIAAYEREMDKRLQEIVRLEAAHAEVVSVKECLEASIEVAVAVEE